MSKMKNIIAANWKMNPDSQKEAEKIFNAIKQGVKGAKSEVVVCPPVIYIPLLKGLPIGAQNVYFEDKGAFTGEVSPAMLKDLGVEYVIIGHFERRKHFGETDEQINKKIRKSLESGLKIIFCIGETTEERAEGKKNEVLERQIKLGLKEAESYKLKAESLNVAYEPVWAIGTGNNCSVEETKESIDFIRTLAPKSIRILYGGSVKSENFGDYIKKSGANGLLVGGASLDAVEFTKIIRSAEQ